MTDHCPTCGAVRDPAVQARRARDEHLRAAWLLVEPGRPSDRARAEALAEALAGFLASPAARALQPSGQWSRLRTALWHAAHAAGELPALSSRQLFRICGGENV